MDHQLIRSGTILRNARYVVKVQPRGRSPVTCHPSRSPVPAVLLAGPGQEEHHRRRGPDVCPRQPAAPGTVIEQLHRSDSKGSVKQLHMLHALYQAFSASRASHCSLAPPAVAGASLAKASRRDHADHTPCRDPGGTSGGSLALEAAVAAFSAVALGKASWQPPATTAWVAIPLLASSEPPFSISQCRSGDIQSKLRLWAGLRLL